MPASVMAPPQRGPLHAATQPALQESQSEGYKADHADPIWRKIRTRKTAFRGYVKTMTTEAILEKSIRYDRGGKPVEVVIPYEQFIEFIETYGLDLSDEEQGDLREAIADRKEGRDERFLSAAEAKRQLGL